MGGHQRQETCSWADEDPAHFAVFKIVGMYDEATRTQRGDEASGIATTARRESAPFSPGVGTLDPSLCIENSEVV